MRIRLTKISDWMMENRRCHLGEVFEVDSWGFSPDQRWGYLVWMHGRAIVVYEDECELIV